MTRPRVLALVVVWLVVAAGISGVVWAVISRTGSELVDAQQPLVATTGTVPATPTRPALRPSTSPSSGAGATAPASQTPGTPTPPDRDGAPSGGTATEAPAAREGTWQGAGGVVTASCSGRAVRLVSAQPADGYRAKVGDGSSEALEVEFEGGEDEGGSVTVVARCVAGAPAFAVERERD
ncbi:hypothetical protein E8D34_18795 [Nocardioides sp. GY 10113]|uniref:hypothetical protein n=1 Tax=Nocardioides sp. GY 10113 TaxID=2569761 RepID=UPI0010A844D2|nr:hypothetical protein [Nocardioides sp. GY 10113]TIC80435.1 hypothetical protein E8D34_18795 [Nocardioides sp. GY 10113]